MKRNFSNRLLALTLSLALVLSSGATAFANEMSGANGAPVTVATKTVTDSGKQDTDPSGSVSEGENPKEDFDCTCPPVDSGEVVHGKDCPLYTVPGLSAADVLALIESLPTMKELRAAYRARSASTLDLAAAGADVRAARAAYDALPDGEKANFDPAALETLTALEGFFVALREATPITILVNDDTTEYGGDSLEAAVAASGVTAAAITALNITAGEVTAADWNRLEYTLGGNNSTLQTFEISDAVTSVADITSSGISTVFPRSITSVTVPQEIEVGGSAFYDCDRLTTVNLPAATDIGQSAFFSCKALATVDLSAAITFNQSAFKGCESLTSVSLPAATSISSNVFSGCTSLATLKLPAKPPTVSDAYAFRDCPPDRSIVFVNADGNALTGKDLTDAQKAYDDVTANGNVAADGLWYGWKVRELPKITIEVYDGWNTATASGVSLENAISVSRLTDSTITTLKITAGKVTQDDWYRLKWLSKLTSFEIDEAVTDVVDIPGVSMGSVFPGSITSVTIPQEIEVGNSAFYSCKSLDQVSLPNVTSIGDRAFSLCGSLTEINLPNVTSIGDSAFSFCGTLTEISLPKVTSIGDSAFSNCTALTSASLPKVTSIGPLAFNNCNKLTTLKLPKTQPNLRTFDVFQNCPTPRSIVFVDAGGTELTGTDLTTAQENYDKVADGMGGTATDGLWYGWKLTPPDKITITVNDGAAVGGDSLSDAVTKSSVAADNITALKITAGAVTGSDWTNLRTTLPALETFEIAEGVTVANIPDVEYPTIIFNSSITSVTIPQAITVGNYAFNDCKALTGVTLPKATSIGHWAFQNCTFTSVSLPAATSIGSGAFYFCKGLTTLKLPATPPTVATVNAFSNGSLTRSVIIVDAYGNELTDPTALATAIADYDAVADGMSGSTATDGKWYGWTLPDAPEPPKITIQANGGAAVGGDSLSDAVTKSSVTANNITALKITAGAVTDPDWSALSATLPNLKTFEIADAVTVADIPNALDPQHPIFPTAITSVTIPQAIKVGSNAFCFSKFTTVELPKVTAIGALAFYYSNLTGISLPEATSIGTEAFLYCGSLTTVNLPKVTNVGNSAFQACGKLTTVSLPAVNNIDKGAFQNSGLATLKLPATPPSVTNTTAFDVCPRTTLKLVGEDGTTELTGEALATAIAAYKAALDGNTTDNLWYGWTLPAAIDPATQSLFFKGDGKLYYRTLPDATHPDGTLTEVPTGAVKSWSASGNTLTLMDFNFTTSAQYGLMISGKATVELRGQNNLITSTYTSSTASDKSAGVYCLAGGDVSVYFKGTSTLTATGGNLTGANSSSYGIWSANNYLTVGECTVTAIGGAAANSYGVHAINFTLDNCAKVTGQAANATTVSYGVNASAGLNVGGGCELTGEAGTATNSLEQQYS